MNPGEEGRNGQMPMTVTQGLWGKEVDPLLDLDLPVSVRFGRVRLPLSQALELGDGSIVELDSHVDDPVEVLVNGKVVALGQLVVVDGFYGVEVTSLPGARVQVDEAVEREEEMEEV